jgi:hypothetical protein
MPLPPLPKCYECGKPVGRNWIPTGVMYSVGDKYPGGKTVLAVKADRRYWNKEYQMVWLGEYIPSQCHGYFDTVKCAQAFAVRAAQAQGEENGK